MDIKDFRTYIKSSLGEPIINVEVTNDQLDYRIDDAVQLFYENHYDGVNLGYIPVDITAGTSSYTLDSNVHDVLEVLGTNSLSFDDPLLVNRFYNNLYNVDGSGCNGYRYSLVDITVWRSNYKNLIESYNNDILFDFNSISKQLILHIEPTKDTIFMLKVYQSELDLEDIYGDRWLKKYAVALTKKQWATNLQKYAGAQMPGGAEFNYGDIMSQAEAEIEKLEEELEDKYSEPPDMEVA